MHELSIATSIFDTVRAEIGKRPGVRASAVGVRIGALSGVEGESLRFGFEAMVRDSDLEPLRLDIELVPRLHKCVDCGTDYPVFDYETQCPGCGSYIAICIGGEELDIAYLEVEEA